MNKEKPNKWVHLTVTDVPASDPTRYAKMNLNKDYINHQVFVNVDKFIDFYKQLSFSIFSCVTLGTKAIFNIDSYVYSSIQGTIESIKLILQNGRINDSYALLRKYYDSVIINIYTNLFLRNNFSLENLLVKKINAWLEGIEQLPEYRVMSKYIRESETVKEITDILYKDQRYKEIRDRCNDHTHYNFYKNVLFNDNEIYLKDRLKELNVLSNDLEQIFIMHISYLFYLNDHYMMASDYLDCLECGLTPEEDSQYLVAPFVQDIFNEIIKKKRTDIATAIKNRTSMKLE